MGANAQTSVPAFTSGQVLTAAQVTQINTGIPVFASSTERDAAFGGTGEKTLAEGQMAYLEDTNAIQYYDGSSWAAIGSAGEATAFTPSWGGFTPGNAVESWYYVQIGDLVIVAGATTLGSTSSVTGLIYLNPPVGSILITNNHVTGNFLLRDNSPSTNYYGVANAGGGYFAIVAQDASSTYLKQAGTSATVPHTWATNDIIGGTIIYEVA